MESLRTCIGCGQKRPQTDMIRIVRDRSGCLSVQTGRALPGRGAYICGEESCVDAMIKRRKLGRAFRTEIDEAGYELIRREIQNRGNIEK